MDQNRDLLKNHKSLYNELDGIFNTHRGQVISIQ